jgi:hypothetical protein
MRRRMLLMVAVAASLTVVGAATAALTPEHLSNADWTCFVDPNAARLARGEGGKDAPAHQGSYAAIRATADP